MESALQFVNCKENDLHVLLQMFRKLKKYTSKEILFLFCLNKSLHKKDSEKE